MMITIKQACELTGLPYFTIRNLCLNGSIRYIRSGNKYYLNRASLLEYLGAADDGRD